MIDYTQLKHIDRFAKIYTVGFESFNQGVTLLPLFQEDIFMYTQKYCDVLKTKPAVGLSGKVPDHDDSDLEKSDDESDDESSDSSKSSSSEMDDN